MAKNNEGLFFARRSKIYEKQAKLLWYLKIIFENWPFCPYSQRFFQHDIGSVIPPTRFGLIDVVLIDKHESIF